MYSSYFGLTEAPFSIAPAPRFLYMSQPHQEALAHLLYGVNSGGGFVLLTGEVGTGKTTICRYLLEQIPETCDVAYIFNPKLTVAELLSSICVEFGIAFPAGNTSIKVFVDCINTHLLDAHARGRHAVLIIDEAQNLSPDVLEQMRLLTNLETSERKLLQIILIGQPELVAMLERPELRQLAQRIVARYHLGPLTKPEVAAYVRHRLEVAGARRPLFPPALMGRLHRLSGGIPRILNVLCDRALLGAFVQSKERVDRSTLAQAAREVLHRPAAQRRTQRALVAAVLLLGGGILAMAALFRHDPAPTKTPPSLTAAGKAASPTPVDTANLAWPTDAPRAESEAMAYAALFRAWRADYRAGDPCRQAESLGLRCHTEHGGLSDLRQMNLPAVLRMRDRQGREFHATLMKLDSHSATLMTAGKSGPVPIGTLAEQWSGHYSLLWRMPPAVAGTIRPGDRGPAVAWLSRQLARMQGRMPDTEENPLFDEALMHQIKLFQLAQGLTPDGTAGPRTLMRLLEESDQSIPSLARRRASDPLHGSGTL